MYTMLRRTGSSACFRSLCSFPARVQLTKSQTTMAQPATEAQPCHDIAVGEEATPAQPGIDSARSLAPVPHIRAHSSVPPPPPIHVLPCNIVLPCKILFCPAKSFLPCKILFCPAKSFFALQNPFLPCKILFCPAKSFFALQNPFLALQNRPGATDSEISNMFREISNNVR